MHDLLSDHRAWNLAFLAVEKLRLHLVDHLVDLLGGYRPFVAGTQDAGLDFRAVILLAVHIFFDDDQRDRLHFFVCRKASAADIAHPAAADRIAVFNRA